jgi:hypothetical protein
VQPLEKGSYFLHVVVSNLRSEINIINLKLYQMKKIVVIFLLTLTTFSTFAKNSGGGKVDPFIESQFKKDFGSAVNVSWSFVQDVSIATFTEKGQEQQVYYLNSGEIFGFGKSIARDMLPESVHRSIRERFNSGIIQTVYEFKSTDSPTRYFVRVVTPRHSVVVSANEFGDLGISQKQRLK